METGAPFVIHGRDRQSVGVGMAYEQKREERRKRDLIVSRHSPRLDEYEKIHNKWDHVVELWDVIRPAWWPILITFALCFLVTGVDQIRDLLAAMPLHQPDEGAAGVSGRFWTTFAACGVFSFMAWAFGRGLLSIRFPYTPCPFDPPAWHVLVRMAVARGLGLALPVSCALSYSSLGMPAEAFAYGLLALGLFLVYLVTRRWMHDWIDVRQELDEAEARSKATGRPMSAEDQLAVDHSDRLGEIDETLEEAEEALDQAAAAKDSETRRNLLEQVARLADAAGQAVRVAGEEFGEAELFDRTMPSRFPPQMRILLSGILAFHAVAAILLFLFPVALSQAVGAVAILFLAIAGWLAFGVFAFCYLTRFWRLPPAILLFTVWLAIASQFNDNHALARLPETQTASVEAPKLDEYLSIWLASRTSYLPRTDADPVFPILIIAAEGGGARAAYWTGTALTDINAAKPASGLKAQDHILMISGVSGGSLGTASYGAGLVSSKGEPEVINGRIDRFLKQDFLSPVTAGALYHDLFTDFIPFPLEALDRAKFLERGWEDGWKKASDGDNAFGEDFRSLWDVSRGRAALGSVGAIPLLVYNTTSVRTGSTWSVAPVRFADEKGCFSRDFVDLIEADDKGISLATAAHLSARFTGISPAGRIDLEGYPDCGSGNFDRFVDGAYYENSGADIAVRVVRALESKLEDFCYQDVGGMPLCDPERMPIIPVAIIAERGKTPNPPGVSHETSSVLMTVANTRSARGQDSLDRFDAATPVDLRKIELAIGWDRSEEAAGCQRGADAQLVSGDQPEIADHRRRRVPLGWALSQAAVEHMCRERLADPVLAEIVSMLETGEH